MLTKPHGFGGCWMILDLSSATELWPLADPACQLQCQIQVCSVSGGNAADKTCSGVSVLKVLVLEMYHFRMPQICLPTHPLFCSISGVAKVPTNVSNSKPRGQLEHFAPVKIFWDYFHILPITSCCYHVASLLLLLGKTSVTLQPLCTWGFFFTVYRVNGT